MIKIELISSLKMNKEEMNKKLIIFAFVILISIMSSCSLSVSAQQVSYFNKYDKKICIGISNLIQDWNKNTTATVYGHVFHKEGYTELYNSVIQDYNIHCINITGSLTP